MIIFDVHDRLRSLEALYRAAGASAAHFFAACQKDPTLLEGVGCRVRDVRDCIDDLEDTYLVRAFAVFEMTLRDYWESGCRRRTNPKARPLIDSIASRCSAATEVNPVHDVRVYRNWLVHGGTRPKKVSMSEGRSYLCKFLGHLPRSW